MVIDLLFNKSGKGLNFILKIKQKKWSEMLQTASQETKTSNLFLNRMCEITSLHVYSDKPRTKVMIYNHLILLVIGR